MPIVLVLLAVIALVLYILFGYLIPPGAPPLTPTGRCILAWLVVILVLIFWFVLPIRIG